MKPVKLTSKNQASVPKEIREFLAVGPGDSIVYEIENDKVVVRKAQGLDLQWHSAVSDLLDEWNSQEDEEAFEHLQNI
ncbi:MAG: AbrB family transcriptional regulator [Pseudobdellovibrionaceae bacterium]|nr:hypothetical protein [Bdellovibrionales bacterium]USN48558.1 MAG: AbrB family transcriptional regulator [Pseudobdellovibrionaceae bacterium]